MRRLKSGGLVSVKLEFDKIVKLPLLDLIPVRADFRRPMRGASKYDPRCCSA